MAEYTAITAQTVAIGGTVDYTNTPVSGCGCIVHRDGSGVIKLRGITGQKRARYLVSFYANVTGATATSPVTLAITLDGEALGSATMIYTPATASAIGNVSASVYVDVPAGCCVAVSVENIGTQIAVVSNANLIAVRTA